MSAPESRHISPQTLDEYLAGGAAASIPIAGQPAAVLTIDPPNEILRLEVSWDGEQPPAIGEYLHISTDVRFRQGRNWATIEVHGIKFFAEAYPLLRSVADLVQLDASTFASAVEQSLGSYHDLLAATRQMPTNEEIGLYGELLVVSHLVDTLGPEETLRAWRGGDQSEEHDIGLAEDDVEVKTTTADRRRHWISSLNQLRPTLGRQLWVLSIQLTAAGASRAERLPDVIARVEAQLPAGLRGTFQARIARTRYRPDQAHESFRLLRLRSKPAIYLVDAAFPRIDHDILKNGGAGIDRIDEVSYAINLDGLTLGNNPPRPFRGLGEKGPLE